MLLKKKMTKPPNLKNIRTIWLLDAMLSCGGKILARRTMEVAGKVGCLADENFGGIRGRSAEQQAVNTRLVIDLALQYRKNTSIAPYDLTSCYDRFVHTFAGIAMRKLGHTKEMVVCRFSMVQELTVNLRTAHGQLDKTNHNDIYIVPLDKSPQGALQGFADDTVLCIIITAPLIQMFKEAGYTVVYKCSITGEKFK